jgi:hypothetical protein
MPFWHKDYVELKAMEKKHKKNSLPSLSLSGRAG